ncbi:MAG: hypothetical protein HY925_11340 [Elusimicrobia bacterium]|nr:hypothetical protein [Elusimicrobiota bacterium]
MNVFFTFLGAILWLASPAPARAASASSSHEIEAKVALESSLEKRLESVLREVLGAKDVVVIVNADMLTDAERKSVEVMPGVPPKDYNQAAAPLAVAPTLVRKISATVFVDKGMKDSDRELAKKTVERLLGVTGDAAAVTLEATTFRHADPIASVVAPENRMLWAVPAAWLAFAAVALTLVYARFLSPLVGVARELALVAKERSSAPAAPDAPALAAALPGAPQAQAAQLEAPPPREASRELEKLTTHFGFIHEKDLPALAFLLSRDATSAAIVLNYLPPVLGAKFLDQLPTAVRQETAALMTQTRLLNKHQVHMVEEGLRERLQYLMGGESRLAEILEGANVSVQTELLGALRERDPGTADRLSRRIVMLEDLALLDEGDFKALSRQVTVRSLATVLAASPDLKDRIIPRLSGGVAEWLTQEIELCGSLPPETIEAEQRRVLTALSRSVREGKIVLRKDDVAPPESPALGGPPDTFSAGFPQAPEGPQT